MVKLVAPSVFAVAALTLASTSALAAPTPTSAPESHSLPCETGPGDDKEDGKKDSPARTEKRGTWVEGRGEQDGRLMQRSSGIKLSNTDRIRRNLPLFERAPGVLDAAATLDLDLGSSEPDRGRQSNGNGQRGRKPSNNRSSSRGGDRDHHKHHQYERGSVVDTLGLDGALSALGLGGLIPTVEGAIKGLPVVGPPVEGVVETVDGTVGVSDLLNPKPAPKPAASHAKRQLDAITSQLSPTQVTQLLGLLQAQGLLNGLGGGNPLAAVGALQGQLSGIQAQLAGLLPGGLGGAVPNLGSTLGGATSALGGAAAPLSGLTGALGGAGGLLGGVTGAVGGVAGGAPAPVSGLPSQLGAVAGGLPVNPGLTLGQLSGLLNGVQGSPLSALTVAQAQALGLLPAALAGPASTATSAVSGVEGQLGSIVAGTPLAALLGAYIDPSSNMSLPINASAPAGAPASPNGPIPIPVELPPSAGTPPREALTLPNAPVPVPAPAAAAVPAGGAAPVEAAEGALHPVIVGAAPAAVQAAAASAPTPSIVPGRLMKKGNTLEATPEEDEDSGSEYDDDSDEDWSDASSVSSNTVVAPRSFDVAPNTWKVVPGAAVPMAGTPSEVGAISEAMKMSESGASRQAAPTTTGARMKRAPTLE